MPVPAHRRRLGSAYPNPKGSSQPPTDKNREAALAQGDSVPSLLLYKLLAGQSGLVTSVHTL